MWRLIPVKNINYRYRSKSWALEEQTLLDLFFSVKSTVLSWVSYLLRQEGDLVPKSMILR